GGVARELDEAPPSTTPQAAFRWDPVDQQWIFNLSTKPLAAGAVYVYSIGLDDGSSIAVGFAVRERAPATCVDARSMPSKGFRGVADGTAAIAGSSWVFVAMVIATAIWLVLGP